MSAFYIFLMIFLSSWLSVCQKLSNIMENLRSSDKNKLGHFLAHPVVSLFLSTLVN